VYLKQRSDIHVLQNVIKEEITATPDNMVTEAMSTLRDRLEQCRQYGGNMRYVLIQEIKYVTVVYLNCILFLLFYIQNKNSNCSFFISF